MAVLPTSVTAGTTGHLAHTGQVHRKLNAWFDVKQDFGAAGDDSTDDTAAVQTALNAAAASTAQQPVVYFPPGLYVFTQTSVLNIPDNVVLKGAGYGSRLIYRKTGTAGSWLTLTNKQGIRFEDLHFHLDSDTTVAGSTLVTLSNSFRCNFTNCRFQGHHTSSGDAFGVTTGHRGVRLTDNAGDNLFIGCDFNNLGVGIWTEAIQNGVIGGKFGICYVGIYGSNAIPWNAGMSVSGYTVFVSPATAGLVRHNIYIQGSANSWWLSDVWTEGADTAIEVGDTGGVMQFGLVNSKLAARNTCLAIDNCSQAHLANVIFAQSDTSMANTTSLTINATNASTGFAAGLNNGIGTKDPAMASSSEYAASTFPNGWFYAGPTRTQVNRMVTSGTQPVLADLKDGQAAVWVDGSGNLKVTSRVSGALRTGTVTVA